MGTLEYRLLQDRHKKPLVVIESALGSGQEIYPDALRSLAAALIKIAAESEARDMGKGYSPVRNRVSFGDATKGCCEMTAEHIAEQLVKDWQEAGKMPPLAWDFRGFAAEAVRRAAANGTYAAGKKAGAFECAEALRV